MAPPIIVSYSELDTFRQCPLKHALAYKQRWTKEKAEDSALSKGTLWHKVLEAHYSYLRTVQQAKQELGSSWVIPATCDAEILDDCFNRGGVRELLQDTRTGGQTEVQELIQWMYEGHVAQWGIDRNWQILAVEHNAVVPLRNEKGNRTRFHLKLKIDLIVRDKRTGTIEIVDHKSGKDLPKKMELDLDDQFGLYTWGCRELGMQARSSIHNAARTQRNKGPMALEDRFSRTQMYRTDQELSNLALDAYRAARVAYSPINEVPFSSPDPRQCGWKCDLKEVHLAARKGIPIKLALRDFGFAQNFERH